MSGSSIRLPAHFRALLIVLAIAVGALAALIPLVVNARRAPREIVLVASHMTFYLEGSDVPNPTLTVERGEEVRIVLRNEEPGVTHDFSSAALDASIGPLRGLTTGSITVRVPDVPGRHEYVCTPHARMMNGVLLVTD